MMSMAKYLNFLKNELVVIFKHAVECLNMSINIIVFRQVKITFSSFTKDLTSLS